MRGANTTTQSSPFITRTVEDFVPAYYPLGVIHELIDESLRGLIATIWWRRQNRPCSKHDATYRGRLSGGNQPNRELQNDE